MKRIFNILTLIAIIAAIVLPIAFSFSIEAWVNGQLEELWALQDAGKLTTSQDLTRHFYERLFGIGMSAIAVLIIFFIFIVLNIGDILKGSFSILIGTKMTEDDDK